MCGCTIVDEHSWKTDAPQDAIILGLKELELSNETLTHRHIHFAHVYKEQAGWKEFLARFSGGGRLYDLEYLVDEAGRRVAAFGHWAGFAGAGLAVKAFCNLALRQTVVLEPVGAYKCQTDFVDELRLDCEKLERPPKAIVIGALGRCGKGAIQLLNEVGVDVTAWDVAETKHGGPFPEIMEHDIFLNCVFVEKQIPPFINKELIGDQRGNLSVVCDVSCDPYGTYNPVPIYEKCTTFLEPTISLGNSEKPLLVIAIDHLPSVLPRESSEDFCNQLMPHLLQLDDLNQGVWKRAAEMFESKTKFLKTER